ncbi:DUF58 domain-containing protein [Actinomarinicola tropica]|uniref:DUF58 domain-containing protein n=1 Tax=Actinomarinicola tropica TaxID=2789776 RepID=A0A5Q2RNU2_9ACTN|nr:DUF58 domain-containing protein [Actinomarinicola tropica]QGG95560.1 DUF58 domain-containing protein [Actinomarinicola tropica]
MILTPQGWALGVAAVALVAAGRFFGTLELFLLGAAAATLLLAVTVRAALTRLDVSVRREVHPPRVHAGTPSRIDLEITNRGRRRTPVLRITDAVSGTRGADLGLGPMAPGSVTRAAYRLPTERRGLVEIGPLHLLLTDPFGLTAARIPAAGRTELTVYPRIDPIAEMPETAGHDPDAAQQSPTSLGRSGEEFFALRPFQIGDELRKVHWPSTARFDELQVRQTELPWQGRATVLLDLRDEVHPSDASLDVAVSAVASIITATRRSGDLVRLVATDGTDSGFLPGNAAYAAILEYLAVVPRSPGASLVRLLDSLARSSHGGALLVVSGALGPHDRTRIAAIRHRFATSVSVLVDRSAWDDTAVDPALPGVEPDEIHITRDRPFPQGWNQVMSHRRRGRHPAGALR